MKIAPLLAVFSLVSVLAACDSLDNPFHSALLNTGRDARVYNGNTGQYEWPSPTPPPRPKPTPVIVKAPAAPASTPMKKVAAHTPIPQKGAFVQGKSPDATPAPAPGISTPTPGPVATPPPPWATKATGYYNPGTGKIEWGAPAPPLPKFIPAKTPKPTPKPKATPTPKASPAKAGKVTPAPKATPAS
jgi:hypothetical protein